MADTHATSFVTHAADVASFYGFNPIRSVEKGVPGLVRTRSAHSFATTAHICASRIAHQPGSPILAYYATPSPSHIPTHLPGKMVGEFGLHVVGSPESIGEALLMKTLFAILAEWGRPAQKVRINALGDRDSKVRFERELGAYLRKNTQRFDASCKDALTKDPHSIYTCTNEECRMILAEGPRPMNFLSEKSRSHFRELLEHIERLGLPYELDDLLVGDDREQRITFAIDLAAEDEVVFGGEGGRYDEHLRKLNNKKDSAGVHASLFFRKKGIERDAFSLAAPTQAPKVYFVQLGMRAKLQSLAVVDMLRKAQVPVSQTFNATSLAPQLALAREQGVSHLLIMGQREALDGTVIVRSTNNSSQTIMQLGMLPRFLKTIR